MATTRRILERMTRQVDELAELAAGDAARLARRAADVSGWSVGEHLQHLALTDLAVLGAIERHERGESIGATGVKTTRRGISLVGRVVLLFGRIPRGRGRAPELVRPVDFTVERLRRDLADVSRRLAALVADPARVDRSTARAPHPVFGSLSASEWMRFLVIHHRHHQRIVRDIERRVAS